MAAYAHTTLSVLRSMVRARMMNTFFTDVELNSFIVEGLRVWNVLTGANRQRSAVTFGAATDYDVTTTVASNALVVLRIDLATSHLEPLDISDIFKFYPRWHTETTASSPKYWIPLGLNKIVLYPRVTGSVNANVDNITMAPVPSGDSDQIQISLEDRDALIDYCLFAASIKEGGAEMQSALPLLKNFLSQAALYNSKLLNSSLFRKSLGQPSSGQINQRPTPSNIRGPR